MRGGPVRWGRQHGPPAGARQAGTQPIVKILYYEGEAALGGQYLLRAVADDKRLRVSLLQRTAENKFLRLNVESADELAGGFPRTRSELFKYQGLILGSIEAESFTPDQLRMIADFVNHRGGGLLMLGSDRSFAEVGMPAHQSPMCCRSCWTRPEPTRRRASLPRSAFRPLGRAPRIHRP